MRALRGQAARVALSLPVAAQARHRVTKPGRAIAAPAGTPRPRPRKRATQAPVQAQAQAQAQKRQRSHTSPGGKRSVPPPRRATRSAAVKTEERGRPACNPTPLRPAPRDAVASVPPAPAPAESFRVEGPDAVPASPFPSHPFPSEAQCEAMQQRLEAMYGPRTRPDAKARPILDTLVQTILSQNTTDTNSSRAFGLLKAAYPDWEQVRTCPAAALEDVIRCSGLAQTKSVRIQAILAAVHAERGCCSLEHLRLMPTQQIRAYLAQFKGVGPKTISCVLLFNLQRPDFTVDTHVFRLAQRAKWVPRSRARPAGPARRGGGTGGKGRAATVSRETTYTHLNAVVPDRYKYPLHLLLIQHGKVHCRARACLAPRACPVCTPDTAPVASDPDLDVIMGGAPAPAAPAGPGRARAGVVGAVGGTGSCKLEAPSNS